MNKILYETHATAQTNEYFGVHMEVVLHAATFVDVDELCRPFFFNMSQGQYRMAASSTHRRINTVGRRSLRAVLFWPRAMRCCAAGRCKSVQRCAVGSRMCP